VIDEMNYNDDDIIDSIFYGDDPYFCMFLPESGFWRTELYEKYRPFIRKVKKRSEWEKLGIIPDDESEDAKVLERTDGCVCFRIVTIQRAQDLLLQPESLNLYEKQQAEINAKYINNTITIIKNSYEQYSSFISGDIYRFTIEHIDEAFAELKWEIRRVIPFEDCTNFYDLAPFHEKPSALYKRMTDNIVVFYEEAILSILKTRLRKITSFKTYNPKCNLAKKTIEEANLLFASQNIVRKERFADVLSEMENVLVKKF
jgi:hypothetical protein